MRRNVDTLWVDAGTWRVVRREHRQFDLRDQRLENLTVAEDYRYNEAPPADAFTWKLPAGAQEEDVSTRALGPEELAAGRRVIEAADRAWSAGDFPAFTALWDFGFLERHLSANAAEPGRPLLGAALRAQLQDQLIARQGQKNPWTSWKAEELRGQGLRSVQHLGNLAEDAPEILWFLARLDVTQADGSAWDARASYYLARRAGNYRLIHWQHDLSPAVLGRRGE